MPTRLAQEHMMHTRMPHTNMYCLTACSLIWLQVSDSTSGTVLFILLSQQTRSRQAFFNTLSRLFDGLR